MDEHDTALVKHTVTKDFTLADFGTINWKILLTEEHSSHKESGCYLYEWNFLTQAMKVK